MTPELACIALAVYFEARGESLRGQIAVAQVVVQRAESPKFPDDVCSVVYQGGEALYQCQFTFWCDGKPDRPYNADAWAVAQWVAIAVMKWKVRLPSLRGALYYHATWVSPWWADHYEPIATIGGHKFYGGLR